MAITAETRTEIIQMVVGTLNAAPGFTILTELVEAYDAGTLVSPELVQIMVDNPAFEQDYPLFLTNEEFAERYFETLLSPAVPELEDETDTLMDEIVELAAGLLNGGMTRAELIFTAVDFLSGASEDDPILGAAVAQFNNKVEVAEYFSVDAEQDAASVPLLQQVIDGVTNDEATVDTALAVIDGEVAAGETVLLTTDQDNIEGTPANTTIKGSFGSATATENTANAGDDIDGGNGTDTLALTAVGTVASTPALVVSNVEAVTIKDAVGGTFNAISIEDAPSITFTNTIDGQTSTVTNADEASVIGLQGAGDLTVTYVTGDSVSLSLDGAGTSSSNRSAIDVSNGDDTESVSIETTGSNYVTLAAGPNAADISVTGDGTNWFNVEATDATAATVTIDASEATGGNTFDLGDRLSGSDVIIGGSGSDSVRADFTLGTLYAPTLTDVESLTLDLRDSATLDLKNTSGLTSISVVDADAGVNIKNASDEITSLTVSSASFGGGSFNFEYDDDTPGDLLNINIVNFYNSITFENLNSLYMVGYMNNFGTFEINGDEDIASITIGGTTDASSFQTDVITLDTGLSVGAFNVIAMADFSGGINTDEGTVGDITFTGGEGALKEFAVNIDEGTVGEMAIGDITINTGGGFSGYFTVSGGNVGNLDFTIADGSGEFAMYVSGGSVGDVTVTVGDDGYLGDFGISANSMTNDYLEDGNVGNVTLNITGEDAEFYGRVHSDGGDIGDIVITQTGDDSRLNFSADSEGSFSGGELVHGGGIGDITLDLTADDGKGEFTFNASGGGIGDTTATISLDRFSGAWRSDANESEDGTNGDIGDVTVEITGGESGYFAFVMDGSGGTLGQVTIDASTVSDYVLDIEVSAGYNKDITGFDITLGEDAAFSFGIYAASAGTEVSDINVTAGDGFSGFMGFSGLYGDLEGTLSVTAGDDSSLYVSGADLHGQVFDMILNFGDNANIDIILSSGAGDVGLFTLIGGDGGDADISVMTVSGASWAGVDAELWEGDITIMASGVSGGGTSITTGDGDADITGTFGDDVIRLGGGDDTVNFLDDTDSTDTIENFSSGDDELNFSNLTDIGAGDEFFVSANAAEQSLTTGSAYVFEDGTDGTDDEEIEDFEDLDDVADFLAAAFSDEATSDEFIAVINDGAGTAYVYYVDTDDGAGGNTIDEDAISLIGVVTGGALDEGDVAIA